MAAAASRAALGDQLKCPVDGTTMIRPALPEDAPAICDIYNHYVQSTIITFEEDAVSGSEMARRISDTSASFPWLVTECDGCVIGYASAAHWKSRSAFRFTVESAIYLKPGSTGRGVGNEMYKALVAQLQQRGIHSVIAGIALPNLASIALHEKLGFRKIGHFPEVGWKLGTWIDVGYWELSLSSGARPHTANR
jgi:L-amino acid N-acyltransferase YncA